MEKLKILVCFGPFAVLGAASIFPFLATGSMRMSVGEFAIFELVLIPLHWLAWIAFARVRQWPPSKSRLGYERSAWLAAMPLSWVAGIGMAILVSMT